MQPTQRSEKPDVIADHSVGRARDAAELESRPELQGRPELPVFFITASVVGIITFAVVCREICLFSRIFGIQKLQSNHRYQMAAFEVCRMFVLKVDIFVFVPGGLNLARAFGETAAESGLLDQLEVPGIVIGSLLAFAITRSLPHERQRQLLVSFLTINAVLEVVLAFLMTSPALIETQKVALVFIVVRLLTGVICGAGVINLAILNFACSSRERAMIAPLFPMASCMGAMMGTLIPSLAVASLPEKLQTNALVSNAVPLLVVAILQSVIAMLSSWVVPLDIQQAKCIDDEDPRNCEHEDNTIRDEARLDILDQPVSFLADSMREQICNLVIAFTFFVNVLINSCVQGVPLLLQVNYEWPLTETGPATSLSMLTGLLVMGASSGVRYLLGTPADVPICVSVILVASTGALLFFDFEGNGAAQLVVASALVFPMYTVVYGIFIGYGFAYSDASKWYSSEFISTLLPVFVSLGSITAGPLVREVAVKHGRNAVAMLVMGLTLIVSTLFLFARLYVMVTGHSPNAKFKMGTTLNVEAKQ